jgi:hypothetical protein
MPKQLHFNEEARRALKRGVDTVAEAVKTTLGPRGRNVAIDKKFGAPTVTHDGVTVAKEIELKDPFENMGARLLVEVATKTNDVAGDGTTTATVLAQAIVTEGLKMVAAGANPMLLKRGLDKGAEALVAELKSLAKPVRDRADIAHVAAISAADSEIGDLIAEVMEKVGKDGVITVEESKGIAFEKEYTEGMQIDRGYISAYFATNQERMEAELDEPYILITDKKISAIKSPISLSAAEIAATCAMSARSRTGLARLLSSATIASAPLSRPRLSNIGLAPAATILRPSVIMAWASTVAVVVPSPTTSLVLVATSTSNRAPIFSKGSLRVISLATVTPSWVTVGAPHFLSIATLRPRGPSVVLTASATMSTPRLSARRASSLK